MSAGVLVVLRGNSGSGKTTVARAVQRRFSKGSCAVVSQDRIRREVLREPDEAAHFTIRLISVIAEACLAEGLTVVVEGILNAGRYQRMLEGLADRASEAHFFAWDLPFEETVRRHATRPERAEFSADAMRRWYHGWQPLDFAEETRFDAATSADDAVEAVLRAAAPSVAACSHAAGPDPDRPAGGDALP